MERNENKALKFVNNYRQIIILLAEIIIFSLISNRFLSVGNLTNVLKQVSINAILAAAVSFAIILGGIDISVGSVVGFTGAVAAALVVRDLPLIVVLAAALLIGALAGLINGIFVAYFDLQPMIVTLATLSVFRGATLVFTNGATVAMSKGACADSFKFLGSGKIFGFLYMPVVIMILVFILVYYIQNKTSFGRHMYAVGGNEEASYLSGLNVRKIKLYSHVICGVLAGLAGAVMCARVGSAQPTAGESYEMDAIAACVVGGTSLRGGEGRIAMTLVGAIIIGMINNILNIMNVSSYWQTIVKGVVILAAVMMDRKSSNN